MGRKKTHEEFMKEFYEKNTDAKNIEILSKYNGNNVSINCRCKIDGCEWSPKPKHLLGTKNTKPSGCPKCGARKNAEARTKTHEEFIQEMDEINPNIIIKSKYTGANNYVECECKIDGHKWNATPHNLLKERSCPKCALRNFSGKNNPRYNSNLTQEDRDQIRNYPEYKEWRAKIFERDNYTCQVTKKRGGKLEVHHFYSYDKYYCLRLVTENGITISKEIHNKFHSIYGYGNNTLEQWEEFINNLK